MAGVGRIVEVLDDAVTVGLLHDNARRGLLGQQRGQGGKVGGAVVLGNDVEPDAMEAGIGLHHLHHFRVYRLGHEHAP